jgi:hypothetical protein
MQLTQCRSCSNVGAVAQLFEISCLFGRPEFSTIQDVAFSEWAASHSTNPLEPELVQLMKNKHNINVEGQHYFVNQNNTLVPVWDLRSSGENAGNPNAIVFAQKVKSASSPDGPENIDWVELKKLSGGLANLVYRVDTVKGQPPSTVSSSLDWCLSFSIKRFLVHPRQSSKCQVCCKLLYVFMI